MLPDSPIFLPLRTFFERKVQEDKERKELEKNLENLALQLPSSLMLPPQPTPPPPLAKKKGQKQGQWLITLQNL